MSTPQDPGYRPGQWETAGDHERRIRALEGLPDCCTELVPSGTSLLDYITEADPTGFWKLDETSGETAFDSSGNGRDLTAGTDDPPTWAQPAGPPGTVTAEFSVNTQRLTYSSYPDLTLGDFEMVGWVRYSDDDPADLYFIIGQGTDDHLSDASGCRGVFLAIRGGSLGLPHRLNGYVGNGSGLPGQIFGDSALTAGTWYMASLFRESGVLGLTVNAVVQADTTSHAVNGGTHTLIFGSSLPSGFQYHLDGRASWWAVYGRVLTSTERTNMYTAGVSGPIFPSAGKVWTSDGSGVVGWEYPTIEVLEDGV